MKKLGGALLTLSYGFVAVPLAWAFIKWGADVVGKFWGLW